MVLLKGMDKNAMQKAWNLSMTSKILIIPKPNDLSCYPHSFYRITLLVYVSYWFSILEKPRTPLCLQQQLRSNKSFLISVCMFAAGGGLWQRVSRVGERLQWVRNLHGRGHDGYGPSRTPWGRGNWQRHWKHTHRWRRPQQVTRLSNNMHKETRFINHSNPLPIHAVLLLLSKIEIM